MKKIIALLLAFLAISCLVGCGEKKEEPISSSSGIVTELTKSEKHDVIVALMGTVRHFEPDLTIPENNDDYTIARVEGVYNLSATAKRPDGSNAMISFWTDINGKDYSVHYFSVKDDVYVDDGTLDEIFDE